MAKIKRFAAFGAMTAVAHATCGAAALEGLFAEFAQPGHPGATVLVAREGKPCWTGAFGLADVDQGVECRPETNFRLASVSKQFTAMAILLLAEERKLSLEDTLPDFFPEFPAYGADIKVRHLLQHTSGVRDYEGLIPPGTVLPVLDRDVLRILMAEQEADFASGTKYRYSNSGYALLAQIVEKRSGRTYASFLQERIFGPLKMKSTLAYEQGVSSVPNRARGHSRNNTGSWQRTDQSLTSSVLGDGGIYSSVVDLALWDRALDSGKLVGRRWLQEAFTPGPASEHPDTGYGFGWYIGQYRGLKEIWHSGNTIGFTTRIARYPEKKMTVIILCNRTDAELGPLLHAVVDALLFAPPGKKALAASLGKSRD